MLTLLPSSRRGCSPNPKDHASYHAGQALLAQSGCDGSRDEPGYEEHVSTDACQESVCGQALLVQSGCDGSRHEPGSGHGLAAGCGQALPAATEVAAELCQSYENDRHAVDARDDGEARRPSRDNAWSLVLLVMLRVLILLIVFMRRSVHDDLRRQAEEHAVTTGIYNDTGPEEYNVLLRAGVRSQHETTWPDKDLREKGVRPAVKKSCRCFFLDMGSFAAAMPLESQSLVVPVTVETRRDRVGERLDAADLQGPDAGDASADVAQKHPVNDLVPETSWRECVARRLRALALPATLVTDMAGADWTMDGWSLPEAYPAWMLRDVSLRLRPPGLRGGGSG